MLIDQPEGTQQGRVTQPCNDKFFALCAFCRGPMPIKQQQSVQHQAGENPEKGKLGQIGGLDQGRHTGKREPHKADKGSLAGFLAQIGQGIGQDYPCQKRNQT